MGIYYDLIGTNGIVSANDRACFGSLKYIETDIGDYLSVKWFPFRCHDYDSNQVMYNLERFGGIEQQVIDPLDKYKTRGVFVPYFYTQLSDSTNVCGPTELVNRFVFESLHVVEL